MAKRKNPDNTPSYLKWFRGECLHSKKLGKMVRFLEFVDGKVRVGSMVLGEIPELLPLDDLSRPEFKFEGFDIEMSEAEEKFSREAEEVRKMMKEGGSQSGTQT